jgi:hypothetical protein
MPAEGVLWGVRARTAFLSADEKAVFIGLAKDDNINGKEKTCHQKRI